MLWLPLAAAFLWRAVRAGGLPPAAAAALVVVGIVAWQLIEYSIHRWLFHLRPTQPLGIFLHFLLHGWVLQMVGAWWPGPAWLHAPAARWLGKAEWGLAREAQLRHKVPPWPPRIIRPPLSPTFHLPPHLVPHPLTAATTRTPPMWSDLSSPPCRPPGLPHSYTPPSMRCCPRCGPRARPSPSFLTLSLLSATTQGSVPGRPLAQSQLAHWCAPRALPTVGAQPCVRLCSPVRCGVHAGRGLGDVWRHLAWVRNL